MSISLRLDSALENQLNRHARLVGKPKSELIRSLISEYLKNESARKTPWELGKNIFGREGSRKGNLSINRKAILKEKLYAKKNRH